MAEQLKVSILRHGERREVFPSQVKIGGIICLPGTTRPLRRKVKRDRANSSVR